MPSVFTWILQGSIPGEFVFKGERWFAILDIRPAHPGHCLLIAVAEVAHLADLPGSAQAELGLHLTRLAAAVKRATGCPDVNIVLNDGPVAGQEVPHVHFHVVPRWPDDGKGFRFLGKSDPDLAANAAKIRAAWGS